MCHQLCTGWQHSVRKDVLLGERLALPMIPKRRSQRTSSRQLRSAPLQLGHQDPFNSSGVHALAARLLSQPYWIHKVTTPQGAPMSLLLIYDHDEDVRLRRQGPGKSLSAQSLASQACAGSALWDQTLRRLLGAPSLRQCQRLR